MEIEATGLTEVPKGRITEDGLEPAALRDDTNLFPGAKVIGDKCANLDRTGQTECGYQIHSFGYWAEYSASIHETHWSSWAKVGYR